MFNKVKTFVKDEQVQETAKIILLSVAIGVVTQIAVAGTLTAIDHIGGRISDEYHPIYLKTSKEEN